MIDVARLRVFRAVVAAGSIQAAAANLGYTPSAVSQQVAALGRETGLPLLPLVVVQTGGASDGLQRDWAPADSGVDKHYGYAFQWFGLSGLVFILYVWFQFVRRLPSLGGKSDA